MRPFYALGEPAANESAKWWWRVPTPPRQEGTTMAKARLKIAHRLAVVVVFVLSIALTGLAETVTNVRGSQRPNSNLVDIYYDLNATDGGTYTVGVAIEGRTNEVTATTFSGDVGKGISPGKNRHVVWDAGADWRGNKGDVKAVVTATIEPKKGKPKKVQLWEGGPYWADRNIGADAPWEAGLYFWWGDTVGYERVNDAWRASDGSSSNFSFSQENTPTYNLSIPSLWSLGWLRADNILAPSHDAAHVKWGEGWRMPTSLELGDLISNCDWSWTIMNGVNGYVVRGRDVFASNSIFLPCVGYGIKTAYDSFGIYGYYWSSSLAANNSYALFFNSGGCGITGGHYSYRYYGRAVRPVQ